MRQIEACHTEAEDLADLAAITPDESAARDLLGAAQARIRRAARLRAQIEAAG